MSLADRLASHAPQPGSQQCTVAYVLDQLDERDAQALRDALADPGIPGTAITEDLQAEGHDIEYNPIRRHRNGGCKCEREHVAR